ncbi:hypothetical protein AB1Y20_010447 [Prymnesium parvum]|uniref:histidine kinase n=1 Tax=Prymnesium parvum TaxID=97485 RepID=A0AB34IPK4_PRYPA
MDAVLGYASSLKRAEAALNDPTTAEARGFLSPPHRNRDELAEPSSRFQALLWNKHIGRCVCGGTVFVYVAMASWVIYFMDIGACSRITPTESTACFVSAALMFSALLVDLFPWRQHSGLSWAYPCMRIVTLVSAITDVLIGIGASPKRVDPVTGREQLMLRWVEWTVLSFTMTFTTEAAASADLMVALQTAASQGASTFCGFLLPLLATQSAWLFYATLSFLLYFHIFFRWNAASKLFHHARATLAPASTKLRSIELSFSLMTACTVTWTLFVLIWTVDAVVYGALGFKRRSVDICFYADLVVDVLAKLVYADLIYMSSPLLSSRLRFDALETAADLRRVIHTANVPIFGIDGNIRVSEWNSKVAEITGFPIGEAVGQNLIENFVHEMSRPSTRHILSEALRGKEIDNFQVVLNTKSKERVQLLLSVCARRDIAGMVVGVLGIGQDVTQLLKAENTATQYVGHYSERLVRSLESSHDLVIQIEYPHIFYASPSFQPVLQFAPSNVLGDVTKLTHVFPQSFVDQISSVLNRMLDGAAVFTVEHPLLHANGKEVFFEHKFSRHPEHAGCVVVVSRDITDRLERHRLELDNTKLITARERDIEAMHFLSHELKNRLNALRGMCHNAQGVVSEHAPTLLNTPFNLRELFEDVLAGFDRGIFLCMDQQLAMELASDDYKPHDSHVELRQALEVASARRARVYVERDVPSVVRLDGNLMLRVLENLVSNAIKYGKRDAEITLRASAKRGQLLLEVSNQPGPKHEAVVEAYGHADCSEVIWTRGDIAQRDAMSTGRGLRISRKCASLLNGTLSLVFLESEVRATLSLPMGVTRRTSAGALAGLVVAALDDDEMVRQIDQHLYSRIGIEAHVRGETAQEILTFPEFVASLNPQPDCVLLDQNLDHPLTGDTLMLGTQLIAPLRDAGYRGPIIIKSANQSTIDRAKYISCGADGTMDKIFNPEVFAQELWSVISKKDHSHSDVALNSAALDAVDDGDAELRVRTFVEKADSLAQRAHEEVHNGSLTRAKSCIHKLTSLARLVGADILARLCSELKDTDDTARFQEGLWAVWAELKVVHDHLRTRKSLSQ